MPTYAISLLHKPGDEPSNGIEPEGRQFANLGEALQRGREMYRAHESSALGYARNLWPNQGAPTDIVTTSSSKPTFARIIFCSCVISGGPPKQNSAITRTNGRDGR
jgi:hypothetical protein